MMTRLHGWLLTAFTYLLYITYFVAGSAFLFTDSPSIQSFTGDGFGYKSWSVLLFIGSTLLVIGALSNRKVIEVCGCLPTACAITVYSATLVFGERPLDRLSLGVALGAIIGTSALWLVIRFLTIWPTLSIKAPARRPS